MRTCYNVLPVIDINNSVLEWRPSFWKHCLGNHTPYRNPSTRLLATLRQILSKLNAAYADHTRYRRVLKDALINNRTRSLYSCKSPFNAGTCIVTRIAVNKLFFRLAVFFMRVVAESVAQVTWRRGGFGSLVPTAFAPVELTWSIIRRNRYLLGIVRMTGNM